MKDIILSFLARYLKKDVSLISLLLEVPQDSNNGDYAFPCFTLAREMKKSPAQIAQDLASSFTLLQEKKEEKYSEVFSWLGNQNHPSEIIIKNGDAFDKIIGLDNQIEIMIIEGKKIKFLF